MKVITNDILRKGKTVRFKINNGEFWKQKLKGDVSRIKARKKRRRKSN